MVCSSCYVLIHKVGFLFVSKVFQYQLSDTILSVRQQDEPQATSRPEQRRQQKQRRQERHPQTCKNVIDKFVIGKQRTSSGSSDDNRIMDMYNNEKCGASTGIINGGMNFKKGNGDPSTRVKKVNGDPKTSKTIESGNQKTGSGNDNRIMSIHDNEKCGASTGTINDGMNFE